MQQGGFKQFLKSKTALVLYVIAGIALVYIIWKNRQSASAAASTQQGSAGTLNINETIDNTGSPSSTTSPVPTGNGMLPPVAFSGSPITSGSVASTVGAGGVIPGGLVAPFPGDSTSPGSPGSTGGIGSTGNSGSGFIPPVGFPGGGSSPGSPGSTSSGSTSEGGGFIPPVSHFLEPRGGGGSAPAGIRLGGRQPAQPIGMPSGGISPTSVSAGSPVAVTAG